MTTKRLNIGCGKNPKQGWLNLDRATLPGVDIVHNIEKLPLPFADEEFDEICCNNVLEHTEYTPILKELHRILKPSGILTIEVPHFTSRNNYSDPTHKKLFAIDTFDFFVKGKTDKDYYFDFHFGKINRRRIKFLKKGFCWGNCMVEPLFNLSEKMQYIYESTFLSRMFPANNIFVELVK